MEDKIILILLATLSALNIPAFKVIGREKGIKDKLLGIEIYKFDNIEKVKKLINENRIIFIEELENLAPVENKLYKLRNDIACNDDISIIAVNLMSLKIALGFRNIVFDISYGDNTSVKTLPDAQKLGKYLVKIGSNLNKNVKCFITKSDEPVGKFFGNTLELEEALNALNGDMLDDVKQLILEIGSNIMSIINESKDLKKNKQRIMEVIENKQAYNKLLELISKENKEINLYRAKNAVPIMASCSGYIENIDMAIIRSTAKYLNAIRYEENAKLDYGAGIEFCKKIGEEVTKGDLIGYVYTNEETKIHKAVQNLKQAYLISDKKVLKKSRIVEVI